MEPVHEKQLGFTHDLMSSKSSPTQNPIQIGKLIDPTTST